MRRRTLLGGLAASGCVPAARDAESRLAPGLAPFHAALAELRAGRRREVAVLQLGDSHTANDGFSGRLRELMQERFGDAGRGFLPPAIPYRYYRPAQLTVAAEGWRPVTAAQGEAGPFGLALLRQRADGAASLMVQAETPGGLSRAGVDVLNQPGGGTIDLRFDTGLARSVSTAGAGPAWAEVDAPGARQLTLTARGDGPVDLLGLRCLTGRPGVTWSNLGTPGATVGITAQLDPAPVAAEVRRLDPSLLVLAFGTNEGFKDSTDLAEYRALFAARLRAFRSLMPNAAVLVALPPGGARRVAAGAGTCPVQAGEPGGFTVPPRLAALRTIQAREAAAAGAAVWDWSAAMGGDCAIVPMTRTDPPAAAPDLVHLFKPGYRATAESLFATLMQGMGGA